MSFNIDITKEQLISKEALNFDYLHLKLIFHIHGDEIFTFEILYPTIKSHPIKDLINDINNGLFITNNKEYRMTSEDDYSQLYRLNLYENIPYIKYENGYIVFYYKSTHITPIKIEFKIKYDKNIDMLKNALKQLIEYTNIYDKMYKPQILHSAAYDINFVMFKSGVYYYIKEAWDSGLILLNDIKFNKLIDVNHGIQATFKKINESEFIVIYKNKQIGPFPLLSLEKIYKNK